MRSHKTAIAEIFTVRGVVNRKNQANKVADGEDCHTQGVSNCEISLSEGAVIANNKVPAGEFPMQIPAIVVFIALLSCVHTARESELPQSPQAMEHKDGPDFSILAPYTRYDPARGAEVKKPYTHPACGWTTIHGWCSADAREHILKCTKDQNAETLRPDLEKYEQDRLGWKRFIHDPEAVPRSGRAGKKARSLNGQALLQVHPPDGNTEMKQKPTAHFKRKRKILGYVWRCS